MCSVSTTLIKQGHQRFFRNWSHVKALGSFGLKLLPCWNLQSAALEHPAVIPKFSELRGWGSTASGNNEKILVASRVGT